MNVRPIIDAGPSLNFFSTNSERMLFSRVGALHMPETVHAEVLRKARSDRRFIAARDVLHRLPARLLEVLSDRSNAELDAAVGRIVGVAANVRRRQAKDLGELMVVAHATVAAEKGHHVTVIIDDGDGRRIATAERRRLERLSTQGRDVGSLSLVSTTTILMGAAGTGELPDRGAMRTLYARMRSLDDGLPPIEATGLLSGDTWRRRSHE